MISEGQAAGGIANVILAAGASTRMKQVKQLLPWGGSTLLEHAIKQALQANSQHVYVVVGANLTEVEPRLKSYPITILYNKNWAQGVGSSIAYAFNYFLQQQKTFDGVLMSLADQPFIVTSFLNALIDDFTNHKIKHIVAAQYKSKKGVPAIFPAKYYAALAQLTGDLGASQLLNSTPERVHTILAENMIFDIDTNADYQKALNTVNAVN